jgi:hypothetical protein
MTNQNSRTPPSTKPADPVDLWLQKELIKEACQTSQPNFLMIWRHTIRIWFHKITTQINRFL